MSCRALPEGLSYDGATRTLSGTLSADATYAAESEGYTLTYQVTDQDGDAPAALEFTIVVHGMPSFHAQVVDDQVYQAGEAVSLGLPAAVGGNNGLTYMLEGSCLRVCRLMAWLGRFQVRRRRM